MQFIQRYHDNSLVYGTPQAARIAQAAKDHGIWSSWATARGRGGHASGSSAPGETIARGVSSNQRMSSAPCGEGDGSDLSVYPTALGRIGALCCWEHLQPLSKYAMYAQNEQVHIAAWPSFSLYRGGAYALGPEVNNAASRIYAVEGQCFVLAPCATCQRDDHAVRRRSDRHCCSPAAGSPRSTRPTDS
jgi:aliphatic nitrilase